MNIARARGYALRAPTPSTMSEMVWRRGFSCYEMLRQRRRPSVRLSREVRDRKLEVAVGALVKAGRVSRTVIKPKAGFHAELPGLDLPTLVQMTCARRERAVVRVRSYGEEGFLFSADGRLVHATVGDLVGDEAALHILSWASGDFSLCERPFPARPSVETSTEGLLLRAAQRLDEAALDRETDLVLGEELSPILSLADQLEGHDEDEPARVEARPQAREPSVEPVAPAAQPAVAPLRRSSVPPPPPPSSSRPRAESRPAPAPSAAAVLQTWPLAAQPATVRERSVDNSDADEPATIPTPTPRQRGSRPASVRLPPPPPPGAQRPFVGDRPFADSSLLASVRIDARGEVVGSFGSDEQLAQLVAYVGRVAALVQADFALDPFHALHAELAGKRVLIFQERGELVGLVMKPSAAAQELRQRLGV